ncbi:MAG: hypothetical protein PHD61_08685, partial [Bacteroidales bacterium]|nr:hypothetical protein [Bacteroidales bacterium]
MKSKGFATLIFFVILIIGVVAAYFLYKDGNTVEGIWLGIAVFFLALILSSSIKIADQWEKVVVLR